MDSKARAHLDRVRKISEVMDGAVKIPGTKLSFGLDAVVGLLPVGGDLITAGVGLYAAYAAKQAGASNWTVGRMVFNTLADAGIGSIPVVGDIADFFFRSHRRNSKILEDFVAKQERKAAKAAESTAVEGVVDVTPRDSGDEQERPNGLGNGLLWEPVGKAARAALAELSPLEVGAKPQHDSAAGHPVIDAGYASKPGL